MLPSKPVLDRLNQKQIDAYRAIDAREEVVVKPRKGKKTGRVNNGRAINAAGSTSFYDIPPYSGGSVGVMHGYIN